MCRIRISRGSRERAEEISAELTGAIRMRPVGLARCGGICGEDETYEENGIFEEFSMYLTITFGTAAECTDKG